MWFIAFVGVTGPLGTEGWWKVNCRTAASAARLFLCFYSVLHACYVFLSVWFLRFLCFLPISFMVGWCFSSFLHHLGWCFFSFIIFRLRACRSIWGETICFYPERTPMEGSVWLWPLYQVYVWHQVKDNARSYPAMRLNPFLGLWCSIVTKRKYLVQVPTQG